MKRWIVISITILIVFIFGLWYFVSKNSEDKYKQSVITTITKLMRQHQIPGAAVAIIDHNKSYIYVFGVADKTNNAPITKETIFEVGSITKLFTALLFIINTGSQNELNNSLTKYCPEFSKNQYLQKVTLEELLTHTSGLPFRLPENITTIDQAQDYLLKWQPANAIGTQWQYSNVGIGLVGILLQNKNCVPINELYRKYILKPLNMAPIGLEVDKKFQAYLAHGYMENGNAAPYFFNTNGLFPSAGDIRASIKDMSRFLAVAIGLPPKVPLNLKQAMQDTQTPRLEFGGIQQGLVWQIHSLEDNTLLNEPEKMNMGPLPVKWLPMNQQVFDGNKLIDKTGATMGFRAYIAVIPGKQLGIVILLNKYISNGAIVNAGRKIILKTH